MEGTELKLLLLLLLTGHSLGDYYFQTQAMADRKELELKALLHHCLVYSVPFGLMALLFRLDTGLFMAGALAVLIHGLVDYAKALLKRLGPAKNRTDAVSSGKIYLLDQGIHWLSLILLAWTFRSGADRLVPWGLIEEMFLELGYTWHKALQWILAFLLIGRPSNITFVRLFSMFKPGEEDPAPAGKGTVVLRERDKLKAGAIIGVLEKMISLIFLTVGEYMAIGLILTAKSIARYDRISKSSAFAEYYLIGTLTSIIMVLLIYFLCFVILG